MAWEELLEPDLIYELPFYLVATIAYGALLTLNPTMRWGSGKAAEQSVPIDFVATLPKPSPNLAPVPAAGAGQVEPPPRKGPGDYEPEKVKAGAQDAPPKPLTKPQPAAVKSNREKHGATLAMPKAKPAAAKTVKAAPKPVDMKAIMAASVARRAKLEHVKAVKAAAVAAAERRAEEARAAAEARAEAARERAEVAREKEEAARETKARRDAQARADAQRRAEAARVRAEALAEAKAAKARKKAELSQELATMSDPDEALAQDADSPAGRPAHSSAKAGAAATLAAGTDAGADGVSTDGAALTGARKAGAAAALADTAESADPGGAAGSGDADLLDAKAKGGGKGPDGAGVSYSLDGPIGSRRVLKRAVPSSPDWVGARGLDLTVTVRFQVLPDGKVKTGAVIRKTSGFPEIDRRALDALRRWRFEPVPAGGPEVWGRATFRFTS